MSARIAVFLPSLAGGGAERMMLHLARGFTERGHEVDLVLSRATGPYLDDVPDGVRVVDLDAGKAPVYAGMGSLLPLRRYLGRTRPDALLSAMSRVNVVAIAACALSGTDIRVVVSERNHLSSYVEGSDQFGMGALPWLVRASYPLADAVVPNSKGVARDLAETAGIDPAAMTVINNPTVTPELREQAAEPVDHEWFADDGPPVVLGVGSLSPQKDFGTLVDAVARLQRDGADGDAAGGSSDGDGAGDASPRLVVLGEGNEREELEARVERLGLGDRVWLPGFVDNPFRYMARADVFALSSRWEGFPNVPVEALACGTPVVATDCPSGPREILADGEYGPLVPVGDADALAEAIAATLADPPDPERLRNRADDFRYDVIADRFLDVLVPGATGEGLETP